MSAEVIFLISENGELYVWGNNSSGQLGLGKSKLLRTLIDPVPFMTSFFRKLMGHQGIVFAVKLLYCVGKTTDRIFYSCLLYFVNFKFFSE